MKVTTRKAAFGGLAMFGAAVLLAGCASAPEDSGDSDGAAASDFLPCMVSDAGGFDDKSFNQLGFEGLTKAADELGVEPVTVQSDSETDFAPNLTNLVDQGCNLIVTVGFALAAAAGESAAANPDIEYVSIDDAVDNDFDGTTDSDNIKPIVFDTAQAAFLAGYAAADYSKTGVVGTFGGMNFPTVSIFMDGFKQGVDYYNTEKGTNVQGPRLGRHRRPLHRWLRGQRHGSQHRAGPHRPERRRAPARRRPDLPDRRRGHPRLRP